jgi:short-subunit dehydrogenase
MTAGGHALITGASAGIGAAYARQLAGSCDSMLIVGRRGDRLQALAEELAPSCRVATAAADLATLEGQARVVEAIRQGPPLDLLINNAGFSTLGPFAASDLDRETEMLHLHGDANLALTRAALPAMLGRDRGAIVNVASVAALLALPGVATYAATKALLLSFSRSLRAELADTGLRVQCLCPGYTRTEIHSRDTFAGFDVDRVPEEQWMSAEAVVEASLAALETDRWLVVPGEHNRQLMLKAARELGAALGA